MQGIRYGFTNALGDDCDIRRDVRVGVGPEVGGGTPLVLYCCHHSVLRIDHFSTLRKRKTPAQPYMHGHLKFGYILYGWYRMPFVLAAGNYSGSYCNISSYSVLYRSSLVFAA